MQLIGTRPNSTWRVSADFYQRKQRYTPGVDPQTGGPVAVVYDWTDNPVPGYRLDTNPDSRTFRQVIEDN